MLRLFRGLSRMFAYWWLLLDAIEQGRQHRPFVGTWRFWLLTAFALLAIVVAIREMSRSPQVIYVERRAP